MQGSCFCGDRQRRAQQVGRLVHSSSMPKPPEVHSRRRRASDLKYLRQTTGAHQRPNHRAREELRAPTGCPLPKLGATGSAAQKFWLRRELQIAGTTANARSLENQQFAARVEGRLTSKTSAYKQNPPAPQSSGRVRPQTPRENHSLRRAIMDVY
ncbi:hypothetical protein MRX96_037007 [Rhipicephalus microplus]